MARYRLSHSADQDFFDIYIYGAQTFGVKRAEAYTAGMQLRFQEIADAPHLYQAVDNIRQGIAEVCMAFMQFITVRMVQMY